MKSFIERELAKEQYKHTTAVPLIVFCVGMILSIISAVMNSHLLFALFNPFTTLALTSIVMIPYELIDYEGVEIKVFNHPAMKSIKISKIVKESMGEDVYNRLLKSPLLLAKFRVGLYRVINAFLDQCPKEPTPEIEEYLKNLVKDYSLAFMEKHLQPHYQKQQCQLKNAYANAKQTIEKEVV